MTLLFVTALLTVSVIFGGQMILETILVTARLGPMKNRLRGDVLVQAVKGRPGKPSWFSPEKTRLSSIE
jgi:hypothetical protein